MVWILSLTAWGQDFVDAEVPPINAQRFRPTIDGQRTLWTDDAARGAHKQFTLRPLIHFADEPMVYQFADGSTTGMVNNVFQMDLMAGFSFDRLRIGVDLPVYLFSQSDQTGGQSGLGDIAVDGKLTVLDQDAPLGFALNGRINLPTGTVDNPLAARNTGWEVAGIVDKNVGPVLLAANLGVRGAPDTDLENVRMDDFFVFRAGAGYAFTEQAGAALELTGDIPLVPDAPDAMPIEWMASGYVPITGPLQLRGGFGTGITTAIAAPDWRAVAGIAWMPKANEDEDKDGILDVDDACPSRPEDLDGEADEDGCPEDVGSVRVRVVDEQGNPIEGASTEIPGTPHSGGKTLSATLDAGEYGVSASAPGYQPGEASFSVIDSDDGKVVEVRLVKTEVPLGTLKVVVLDVDGNPVPGAEVEVEGGKLTGGEMQRAPGPVTVRARAEGFKPVEAQTANLRKDEVTRVTFILEAAAAELTGDRIDLRDSVYFDTAKATIQPRSYDLLGDVVDILEAHPELTEIRIEGHTDSRGSASYNKDLSQRRANSVRQYLIERGVPAARLVAVGFGEEKPLDDREVAEAWERNRRVDFFVSKRSD